MAHKSIPEGVEIRFGRDRKAENDVRFGSKADVMAANSDVRCSPESGHRVVGRQCPLSARSRFVHCSKAAEACQARGLRSTTQSPPLL